MHHFDCWCGTVYHTVRGKQARLATTGVLVIKIGVIVIMIQSSRCFSNFETTKRLIVKNDILQ
jgi:hypothetical protein